MKYIIKAAKGYFKGFLEGTLESLKWVLPVSAIIIIFGAIMMKQVDTEEITE